MNERVRRSALMFLVIAITTGGGALGTATPANAQAPAATAQPFLTGLGFVTNMAFAPSGGALYFIEKDGGVFSVQEDANHTPTPFKIGEIDVTDNSETGLLGLALHPDFAKQPWMYLYASRPSGSNELLRAKIGADGLLGEPELLRTFLPTENGYHNGGDIVFGTDGKLYVTVGEIHESERAQQVGDIGGKVLRLNDDGSIPEDNPFGPDNPAYSMGHRNSFGLCVDRKTGALWETENGPARTTS